MEIVKVIARSAMTFNIARSGGQRYKCTYMYAHLYILLCFGSLRDPPTPSCTKVYFILLCFGRKFDHPPPKWYFCTEKLTKSAIFSKIPKTKFKKKSKKFEEFFKKIGKLSRIFQQKLGKFSTFFPKFDLFFAIFREFLRKFCTKVPIILL